LVQPFSLRFPTFHVCQRHKFVHKPEASTAAEHNHAEESGLVISLPHQKTIRSHRTFGQISCPTYVTILEGQWLGELA